MSNPQHILQVLRDPKGKKDAEKFYETYHPGQDKDYARFAEWLIALDRLMQEFGCRPLPPEPDVPEDEEEAEKKAGEDAKRPNFGEDQEYGPDEDLHANAAMNAVEVARIAVAKVLGKR